MKHAININACQYSKILSIYKTHRIGSFQVFLKSFKIWLVFLVIYATFSTKLAHTSKKYMQISDIITNYIYGILLKIVQECQVGEYAPIPYLLVHLRTQYCFFQNLASNLRINRTQNIIKQVYIRLMINILVNIKIASQVLPPKLIQKLH